MANPNFIAKLAALPLPLRRALETITALARKRTLDLYLVGGPVRDLLLGSPSLDLDLTVEGDGPALAREAAASLGARCLEHPPFLTAALRLDGYIIDIATARSETYEHPGALPRVHPASIREDLDRRDFTINAMALPLTGPGRGRLLDPLNGRTDLAAGVIRVLHERSFIDDATRIIRAARYEVRFGFRFEERTEALLQRDVVYLETISGARIREELSRILSESEPERALLRLQALGAPPVIHPALDFDEARVAARARLREMEPEDPGLSAWALLGWGLSEGEAGAVAGRLALTKAQSQAVCAMPALQGLEQALAAPDLANSRLVETLSGRPAAAVWALAAATDVPAVRERCLEYLRVLRRVKPALDGNALISLGVPEGPPVGEAMARLKAAKLDGEVRSRADEERFVRSLLAKAGAKGAA